MSQPTYTPYFPLQVAKNLRFLNQNGDLVTQLYPVGSVNGVPNDSPTTGYISLIGANVSTLIDEYNQTTAILNAYNVRITTLEADVAALQLSGITLPSISGQCLNSNISAPLDTITALLVTNSCNYNTVLGTPSALAASILAECSALNTSPAYSQNSVMSGLTGWVTTPSTIANAVNNIWLAYCDMRAGVTQALSQSNVTCADIHINYQGVYDMATRTINFYFYGSSIPANFSTSGTTASFTIKDTAGNTYTHGFNLNTAVTTGVVSCDISASALYQNTSYSVIMSYSVTSTTPALGCSGSIPSIVLNNTVTCPNVTVTPTSSTSIQFSFTPTIITNVSYVVDLLDASGSTVLATKSYVNPIVLTTDVFTGLTPNTYYNIRTTVSAGENVSICPSTLTKTPA